MQRIVPVLFLLGCTGPSPWTPARPNILLILADDMGFSDLGCYGGEIRTPNLDRLAATGLQFTQFYNSARCCPTRASLLTGIHPHQADVGYMTDRRGSLGRRGYRGHLGDRCATIAEVLRPAGYRTFLSGKWHVGNERPHWPIDRGFDRSFALIGGGSRYFAPEKSVRLMLDGNPWTPPANGTFYMTDAIADYGVRFLQEAQGNPFFMYVAFTAPHWPLHAWPEEIARYRDTYRVGWDAIREARRRRMVERGVVDARWDLSHRDSRVPRWEDAKDREFQAHKMAVYAAMVDRLDQGVGRILGKLDEIGARQNTLVLFLSDNGASAEEYSMVTPHLPPGTNDSFHTCGPPWANASNTPFRLYKHWVHEGGISTPFIASWPAMIAKPGLVRQPGHIVDVMATCVDVAGARYPERVLPMEGTTLRPLFQGGTIPERTLFWEHEGNRAVRRGRWKLVSRFEQPWELYDLEADRTETKDLAALHPERVRTMSSEWDTWAARCHVLPFSQVLPKK